MTIKRMINGVEHTFELTVGETLQAYREVDQLYHVEDAMTAYCEEHNIYDDDCPLDRDALAEIAENAIGKLDYMTGYWEDYWYCFGEAVHEWEEEHNMNEEEDED